MNEIAKLIHDLVAENHKLRSEMEYFHMGENIKVRELQEENEKLKAAGALEPAILHDEFEALRKVADAVRNDHEYRKCCDDCAIAIALAELDKAEQ